MTVLKSKKRTDMTIPNYLSISTFKEIFEPGLIKEMETSGKLVSVHSGSVIMEIGQMVRTMPIVLKGSIRVSRIDNEGNELFLYYVNPEESCAMTFTCCMQNHLSEIRAVAESDVDMMVLSSSLMDEWLTKYPSWKNFVMRTIQIRFNELLKTIDQIAFQNLDQRLIKYLKGKSKISGSSVVNISHQKLADDLGSSRVVISRLLKKLETDKKLLLYRNQVKLLKNFW